MFAKVDWKVEYTVYNDQLFESSSLIPPNNNLSVWLLYVDDRRKKRRKKKKKQKQKNNNNLKQKPSKFITNVLAIAIHQDSFNALGLGINSTSLWTVLERWFFQKRILQ